MGSTTLWKVAGTYAAPFRIITERPTTQGETCAGGVSCCPPLYRNARPFQPLRAFLPFVPRRPSTLWRILRGRRFCVLHKPSYPHGRQAAPVRRRCTHWTVITVLLSLYCYSRYCSVLFSLHHRGLREEPKLLCQAHHLWMSPPSRPPRSRSGSKSAGLSWAKTKLLICC